MVHFLATQYKKILQEAQVCLNRTQEPQNQTADNSNYTIFYLAKGLKRTLSRVLPKSNKTSSYIEDHSEYSLTSDPCVS